MKNKLLTLLRRWGITYLNQKQVTVAFLVWLFPLGTLWLALYLWILKTFRQTRVMPKRKKIVQL